MYTGSRKRKQSSYGSPASKKARFVTSALDKSGGMSCSIMQTENRCGEDLVNGVAFLFTKKPYHLAIQIPNSGTQASPFSVQLLFLPNRQGQGEEDACEEIAIYERQNVIHGDTTLVQFSLNVTSAQYELRRMRFRVSFNTQVVYSVPFLAVNYKLVLVKEMPKVFYKDKAPMEWMEARIELQDREGRVVRKHPKAIAKFLKSAAAGSKEETEHAYGKSKDWVIGRFEKNKVGKTPKAWVENGHIALNKGKAVVHFRGLRTSRNSGSLRSYLRIEPNYDASAENQEIAPCQSKEIEIRSKVRPTDKIVPPNKALPLHIHTADLKSSMTQDDLSQYMWQYLKQIQRHRVFYTQRNKNASRPIDSCVCCQGLHDDRSSGDRFPGADGCKADCLLDELVKMHPQFLPKQIPPMASVTQAAQALANMKQGTKTPQLLHQPVQHNNFFQANRVQVLATSGGHRRGDVTRPFVPGAPVSSSELPPPNANEAPPAIIIPPHPSIGSEEMGGFIPTSPNAARKLLGLGGIFNNGGNASPATRFYGLATSPSSPTMIQCGKQPINASHMLAYNQLSQQTGGLPMNQNGMAANRKLKA